LERKGGNPPRDLIAPDPTEAGRAPRDSRCAREETIARSVHGSFSARDTPRIARVARRDARSARRERAMNLSLKTPIDRSATGVAARGRRARARTVTLVALRAATEPVKEEAMQAILEDLMCV